MRKLGLNANPRVTNIQFAEQIITLLKEGTSNQVSSMLNINYKPSPGDRIFTESDVGEINAILHARDARASFVSGLVGGRGISPHPFFTIARTMESGYDQIPGV